MKAAPEGVAMLSEIEIETEILRWLAMTPEERKAVRVKLDDWYEEVIPDEFVIPGSWGFTVVNTRNIARGMASRHGAKYAVDTIELALFEGLFTPEMLGWVHTFKHLLNALADPDVQRNPIAVSLLETLVDEVNYAVKGTKKSEFLVEERKQAVKDAISKRASNIAKVKNQEPRAWVLSEWQNRTDMGQSKASFARQYTPQVKTKYGLLVLPETISRDWLPKTTG